ncbi:GTPase activating protein [Pleurotus pulmonarius]|nr:GTPase activating protein [Pleurotus pulmonarius]
MLHLNSCDPVSSPSSFDGSLSTISFDSMVEIKRSDIPSSPEVAVRRPDAEDDKHRLLYTRSKVYVHPTAYARDNIPGFVALVKREATNAVYFLAWIPESLLNEKGDDEWKKFTKIEESSTLDEEDDDVVFIDLPNHRPESYAFSVPLTSIYSLIIHPPSLSSWYGSMAVNLINGDTLPTLHFHDDESRSFTAPTPKTPQSSRAGLSSYPPPPTDPPPKYSGSWGGDDLLNKLRSYSHLLRSTLQPSLYLVDPSKADMETHTTQIFDDDAVDDILAQSSYANSHSPVPAHRRPRPLSSSSPNPYSQRSSVLHRSLGSPTSSSSSPPTQARMALLQSFSNITRATRHAAQNILSHPLAKPIVPHLPDPVRSLVNVNGETEWGSWVEKGGVGEFESARVYLARWARIVAEEGERARRREAQSLPSSSASNDAEETSLGVFELLHSAANLPTPKSSRDPAHPIDQATWDGWFGKDGKPRISKEEMKGEVFRRGISPRGHLRRKLWPFVLGVHEWDVTSVEREKQWSEKRQHYKELKGQWYGVDEVFERQDVVDERHRIDVDCRRTDRTHPLFASNPSPNQQYPQSYSISPQIVDIGAQSPSNEHVDRLGSILLTYNFYNTELGYVQGMSDLCAPIYVIMASDDEAEELTFWCFVEVMNRMKQNFLRDQSGMKKQLLTLQQLIGFMDPELYRHLEKIDGLNLFFCFRWVLISFKREFSFDDVLKLWEVLWTDYYSIDFVLFIALAILESHRDMILRYLVEFDEILKYCNELSMTIELDSTIAQAEVLFLSFSQLVADMDRRRAEDLDVSPNQLRQRHNRGGSGPANNIVMPVLYALKTDPSTLPPTILFSHDDHHLVVFDAFPKGIFHFLLLPRVQEPFSTADLSNLRSLLKCDRDSVKATLEQWKEDAKVVVKDIEDEMVSRYGFKWDIWVGFHAVPSMEHIHLHIVSSDLCSEKLKHKKHYNSFHPKLGFFLHLDEVLSWFDTESDSYFATMAKLDKHKYEALLKEDLSCWRCGLSQKNMPTLKAHLQTEFDELTKKEKAKQARKRKFVEKQTASSEAQEVSKKPKASTSSDHEAEE